MKKLFSSLFLFLCLAIAVEAVPAYPGLLTKTQPDGSTISYYLRGDESCSFAMSEDGFLITTNQKGIFEYAELNDQMEIVPVGIKVSALNNRTLKEKRYLKNATKVADLGAELEQIFATAREVKQQRANASNAPVKRYPLKGSPTSLVILVNYTDVAFTSPTAKEDFTALLNQKGYSNNDATGSAKDFFEACSNGIFSPDFIVVGPYTLPKDMAYYGTDYGVSPNRNENYASQMIIDACKAADADVNFKDYDTDGDGYIDNVFVYYAGHNQAEGGPETSIWPHRSVIYSKQNLDGVLIKDYACTSEFRGSTGTNMCGIGTFCHEFGHVLSLPDFYVTDYGHNEPTLGSWDAMDQGPYNNGGKTPPSYSSYERFFLGWLEPTILEPGMHELKPLLSSNSAYILADETPNLVGTRPNPTEFFMIENRQREGWDSVGLPGVGMLITHIDWVDSKWRNNSVNNTPGDMGVAIVCAAETTRRPAFNTYPGEANITTRFLSFKDGYQFPDPITAIKEKEDGSISFIYGETPNTPYITKEGEDLKSFVTEFGTALIKSVNFKGHSLSSNVKFELTVASNFRIRKQGEETFKRSLTAEINPDSTLDVIIEFQFDPRRITLEDDILTDRLTLVADNYDVFYELEGKSTKPINVKKPLAYEAKDITESSFVASWQKQPRATCYYLSVYSYENAVSSEIEGFAVFTEKEKPQGWEASFATTSSLYKLSTPLSVYFKTDADTLWSKEYFSPIDKVNVWLHSNNTIGLFYVDGLVNGEWVNVFTKEITPNVKRSVESFELGENACTKFRMYYKASSTSTGGVCLDDFEAVTYTSAKFVYTDLEVYDTLMNVVNLVNDRLYHYKLRASDKDLEAVSDPNELISAYSNEVTVKLVGYTAVDNIYDEISELLVEYAADGSGDVFVDLGEEPNEMSKLYIYSIDGRLITSIIPEKRRVKIDNLVSNNLYIVKYSSQGAINQTTKIGKIVY